MKPIEPGCMAVIIKSKNTNLGRVVTVIRGQTEAEQQQHAAWGRPGVLWKVYSPIPLESHNADRSDLRGSNYVWYRDESLMRIDGGDAESEIRHALSGLPA